MIKCLLTCSFTLYSMFVFSQNNVGEPFNIIPPSPNAAALQKYGDIPVGLYNGIPNVAIPLYEIKSKDISVPISISYHASGIKVSDEASRVGLGWALNAGGVITRQIMGQDDFEYNSFNYHNGNLAIPETVSDVALDKGRTFNIQTNCTVSNMPNNPDYSLYVKQENYDFEPDQYSYNFNGYSGKFILKRDKTVILGKKEKITITVKDANASSWEIVTADGYHYLFEEYEAYTDPNTGAPLARKSAWYLTKIISPTDETVTFTYIVNDINYIKPVGSYFESTNPTVMSVPYAGSVDYCPPPVGSPFPDVSKESPRGEYRNVYLDKVSFNLGEIKFMYNTNREDVYNDYSVSKIQIFAKTFDQVSTQKLIKEWEFVYGYFVGTGDVDYIPTVAMPTQITKRLKLTSLLEKDGSGNGQKPYNFSYYNDEVINTDLLPVKSSFSRDHWGYFNKKYGNVSLIPSFSTSNSSNPVAFYLGVMGTERDTDPLYANLFSLKEIQYPTGGKTVFDYESNTFDFVNSKINDHSFYNAFPEAADASIFKLYQGNVVGDQPSATTVSDYLLDLYDLYTAPSTPTSNVVLKAFFRFKNNQTSCGGSQNANKFSFTLMKEDGTIVAGPSDPFTYLPPNNPTLSTCIASGPGSYQAIQFSNTYALSPGRYIWKLHINSGGETLVQDVALNLYYTSSRELRGIEYEGAHIDQAGYAGGLRIKRMTNYANFNAPPIVKHYLYHHTDRLPDSTYHNYSYGRRMARPIYTYIERSGTSNSCATPIGGSAISEGLTQHIIRESESNFPLNGSALGAVVGYDKVIELLGENGENGKNEYTFENQPDISMDYSESEQFGQFGSQRMPRKPPLFGNIPNAGNGNLLNEIQYGLNNGSFHKVKETNNSYTEYRATFPLWWGIEKRVWKGDWLPEFGCRSSLYIYPAIVESRKLLTNSITTVYDRMNNSKYLTTTTTYTYDHSSHLQLISSSVNTSKGESINTNMKYPLDYTDTDADAAINLMKTTRHMHNMPIYKSSILVKADASQILKSAEVNKYQVANGKVLQLALAKFESPAPLSPGTVAAYIPSSNVYPANFSEKIKYEHDINCNLAQLNKTSDFAQAYIWSYNAAYPIAEIKNSTISVSAHTSFEADGTGNWNTYTGTITTLSAVPFPPTGKKYYNLTSTATLSKSVTNGQKYIVSYWRNSNEGAYLITGGTSTVKQGLTIGSWTYYEHMVTASSTTLTITGTGGIDEVRLYPSDAQMTTYTYEPLVGITSACDVNNRVTYYEYDTFQRLLRIRDQDGNILKTFDYKYQQ